MVKLRVSHRIALTALAATALAVGLWLGLRGETPASARRVSLAGSSSKAPATAVAAPIEATPSPAKPAVVRTGPGGLPLALPDTPAVTTWLHEQGMPDARETQDYLLGLYAHVHGCMAGTVVQGEMRFVVHWIVDDEHVGRASYEPDSVGGSTGLDDAARDRFESCVSGYLEAHDAVLPSAGGEGRGDVHWVTAISFPIPDQEIYRLISKGELPDTGD